MVISPRLRAGSCALLLASAAWVQAAPPALHNHSKATWFLKFCERQPRVALLDRDNPLYKETVVTLTRSDGRSLRLARSGRTRSAQIRTGETVHLLTGNRSFNNIEEVFTLQDSDGRKDVCSIVLRGPGQGRNRSPLGPSFQLWVEDPAWDRAIALQEKGIVQDGRAGIRIESGTFAAMLKEPADPAALPDIKEEKEEVKSSPAPPPPATDEKAPEP